MKIHRWSLDYNSAPSIKPEGCDLFITGSPVVAIPTGIKYPLAYISWSECGDKEAKMLNQDMGIAILGQNPDWDTNFMDCGNPDYLAYVMENKVRVAFRNGYAGIYVDTFDGMADCANNLGYPEHSPERQRLYDGGNKLCREIKNLGLVCVPNRGLEQMSDIVAHIDGILLEGAWYEHGQVKVKQSERNWIFQKLQPAIDRELPILTLDYVPNAKIAKDICFKSLQRHFTPLCVKDSLTSPKILGYPGKWP